jgi:hypothetical protein
MEYKRSGTVDSPIPRKDEDRTPQISDKRKGGKK